MILNDRIEAFSRLGDKIRDLSDEDFSDLAFRATNLNAWFTTENVKRALEGIAFQLEKHRLEKWMSAYKEFSALPKIVGIVMAGNIPLVGFHDLLSVLISGHFAAIKTSSSDEYLPKVMVEWLIAIEPRFKKNIEFRERLTGIDAVIATGSDNTSRYFEYYFRGIPHIIRKNRTSIAVLKGSETSEDLLNLGKDIFWYFGMGCRNVSKLLVPKGYDPAPFFEAIESFKELADHHKYKNNYDYYKSIYLVNGIEHLDNGFILWHATEDLVSPLSVIYAQEYKSEQEASGYLNKHEEKIQCVVGSDHIPFGSAQLPTPWDYADKVDTIAFLAEL